MSCFALTASWTANSVSFSIASAFLACRAWLRSCAFRRPGHPDAMLAVRLLARKAAVSLLLSLPRTVLTAAFACSRSCSRQKQSGTSEVFGASHRTSRSNRSGKISCRYREISLFCCCIFLARCPDPFSWVSLSCPRRRESVLPLRSSRLKEALIRRQSLSAHHPPTLRPIAEALQLLQHLPMSKLPWA